jgi:hypothetical protein
MPANRGVVPPAKARQLLSDEIGPMIEAAIYIVFCLLTGLCGIDRRMGFFGTFLLALATTPLVVLPVLLLTGPSRRAESRRGS